jgi:hypothetical protein
MANSRPTKLDKFYRIATVVLSGIILYDNYEDRLQRELKEQERQNQIELKYEVQEQPTFPRPKGEIYQICFNQEQPRLHL